MYTVGAKVVHPCYGAGTIVKIQEKDIGTTIRRYYVIYTVGRPMQLMVAVENAQSVGLRDVGPEISLRETLNAGSVAPVDGEISADLRGRQMAMRERLKSGEFNQVVDVVRQLFFLNARRPLGSVDRQLFDQGKDLLAGELALSCDAEVTDAMHQIEGVLANMFGN
ncbi:MAG: CarD family transcriptional regulator [Anaerolineae bacterium]